MNVVKKEGSSVSLNLSPSSLNLFYQSPLLFYLTYIAKVSDDTPVPVCYGLSGTIVHQCLERYAQGEFDRDGASMHLAHKWEQSNLTFHKDVKGQVLNQIEYLTAMLAGIRIIDEHEAHLCEETINFPLQENANIKIGVKGIIDLQAQRKHDKKQVIIDFKTSNSVNTGKTFERQALFYNFLLHKKKQMIPHATHFHYLKLGVKKEYVFDLAHIEAFELELRHVADQILSYGLDIGKYPIGEIDDLFNSKKQACLREIARRNQYKDPDYIMEVNQKLF